MLNEGIKKIYAPIRDDDWFLAETDRGFYELRMGGFKAIAHFDSINYEVSYEFPDNVIIEEAHTDDEDLYFRLSNNEYLLHRPGFFIDADGALSTAVQIYSRDEIEQDFGESFNQDPDIRKLKTDPQGNSL